MSVFLFYKILSKSKNNLPPEIQEVIIEWSRKAPLKETSVVLSFLAERDDLSDNSIEIISKNKSAKVVSAMLLNPNIEKEVTGRMLEKEKRISVLHAVASVTKDEYILESLLEKNNSKILDGIISNQETTNDIKAISLIKLVNLTTRRGWSAQYKLQSFLAENPDYVEIAVTNLNKESLAVVLDHDLRNLSQSALSRLIKILVTDKLVTVKDASESNPNYFSDTTHRSLYTRGVHELQEVLKRIRLITSKANVIPSDFTKSAEVWKLIKNSTSDNLEEKIPAGSVLSLGITWLEAAGGNEAALNEVTILLSEKTERINGALQSDDPSILSSIVSLVYNDVPDSSILVDNLLKNKNLTLDCLPLYRSTKQSARLIKGLIAKSTELTSTGENHIENYIKATGDISIVKHIKNQDKKIELISRGIEDYPAWRLSSIISRNEYVQEITEALTIQKIHQLIDTGEHNDLESYILDSFTEFLNKYPEK